MSENQKMNNGELEGVSPNNAPTMKTLAEALDEKALAEVFQNHIVDPNSTLPYNSEALTVAEIGKLMAEAGSDD